MVRFVGFLLLAGVATFLVSCGNEGADSASATPPPQKGFEQKSGELFDDDSDKMINRYAKTNPIMQEGEKGSASEGVDRKNQYFEGEIAKRDFAAKDYSKKSFWGSKEYARKVYGGPTDGSQFKKGSRYDSKGAMEGAMTSPDSGSRYATSRHATGAASEGGQSNISKVTDARTDSRRNSYKQPEITDWRNQQGLTIDDTRSMLGRSD